MTATMPTCCPPASLLLRLAPETAPTTRLKSASRISKVASSPCQGPKVAGAAGTPGIIAGTARIRRLKLSSPAHPSTSGLRYLALPCLRRGLRVWCRARRSCAWPCLRRRRVLLRSRTTPRRRTSSKSSPGSTPSRRRLPCRVRPWHRPAVLLVGRRHRLRRWRLLCLLPHRHRR